MEVQLKMGGRKGDGKAYALPGRSEHKKEGFSNNVYESESIRISILDSAQKEDLILCPISIFSTNSRITGFPPESIDLRIQ